MKRVILAAAIAAITSGTAFAQDVTIVSIPVSDVALAVGHSNAAAGNGIVLDHVSPNSHNTTLTAADNGVNVNHSYVSGQIQTGSGIQAGGDVVVASSTAANASSAPNTTQNAASSSLAVGGNYTPITATNSIVAANGGRIIESNLITAANSRNIIANDGAQTVVSIPNPVLTVSGNAIATGGGSAAAGNGSAGNEFPLFIFPLETVAAAQ